MGVLEAGKIYVLITEPPGKDPDGVADIGVEGIAHVVMDIPQRIIDNMSSRKEYGGDNDFPGGGTYVEALGYWSGLMAVTGIIQDSTQALTLTRQGNWKKFVCEEREDTSLYLCICFGANVYWYDYDVPNTTLRQYSEGAFVDTDLTFKWMNTKTFAIETTFIWKSNW